MTQLVLYSSKRNTKYVEFYIDLSDNINFLNIDLSDDNLYDCPDQAIWLTKEQVKQLRDFLNQLEI